MVVFSNAVQPIQLLCKKKAPSNPHLPRAKNYQPKYASSNVWNCLYQIYYFFVLLMYSLRNFFNDSVISISVIRVFTQSIVNWLVGCFMYATACDSLLMFIPLGLIFQMPCFRISIFLYGMVYVGIVFCTYVSDQYFLFLFCSKLIILSRERIRTFNLYFVPSRVSKVTIEHYAYLPTSCIAWIIN